VKKRIKFAPPAKPTDPVSRYALAVGAGKILAGRAVRLACARHLTDYARQRTRDFPYYFSPKAAKHIIDFFPAFIRLEDGSTPMVLAPWQVFCLGSLFGWRRVSDDGRRFQIAYIETAKGSGKSPALAAVGIYGLAFDGEPSAEIYVGAFDRGQAANLFNHAVRMATDSPDLAAMLDIGKYNIAHVESNSFFRAMSSEHRSKSGPIPHFSLQDEIHEQRDGMVINKMIAGFKNRRQPLELEITNSGFDKTSICWQHHAHSIDILEGTIADEQWFAYVCQLDPCEACYGDGYREPKDGCEDCDDWTDPAVWEKTNPSLSIELPRRSYLQSQVDAAQSMPSDQGLVKRLNFCCWTQTHTVWIPPDFWDACRVPAVSDQNVGQACALGFDMSEKLDLTSGVVALRVDDEHGTGDTVELVEMIGDQAVKKTLNLNFCVELIPFFWLPEDTLRERVTKERIPFDVWARMPSKLAPYLRSTPGPVIDHDLIYEQVMNEIVPAYSPQRIGYDPHNATQFAVALRDKGRQTIVEVKQGRALSESFKLFEALVRLKRIRHAGNPVLGWCVANAEPKRDRYENLFIEKPSQTKRIDGLIAAVIALSQLTLLTGDIESEASRDFEERGLFL
jgi:phage terminase large subunit-like protein